VRVKLLYFATDPLPLSIYLIFYGLFNFKTFHLFYDFFLEIPVIIFCLFRPFAALAALKTRRQARGWTPGDRPRSGTQSRITRHPGMSNWHYHFGQHFHLLCIAFRSQLRAFSKLHSLYRATLCSVNFISKFYFVAEFVFVLGFVFAQSVAFVRLFTDIFHHLCQFLCAFAPHDQTFWCFNCNFYVYTIHSTLKSIVRMAESEIRSQ
jgi:hypothetical protein